MEINFNKNSLQNTCAQYPSWECSNKRQWDAFGEYNKSVAENDDIGLKENFTNNENENENEYNYQDFLYSILAYFYIKKDGLFKEISNSPKIAKLISIKNEEIPQLNYRNGTDKDIKSDFTITLVDMTTYLPKQPRLRMICNIDNGLQMKDIDFINSDPTDMTMREYELPLTPFNEIKFLFDLKNMTI
jgi:hypothetical protein